ncbi:MAG: transporter [Rhodococcus sp.]|nr:transporter [Rhodococcus sp. (in: high G+C Gram-positive bacteria)]
MDLERVLWVVGLFVFWIAMIGLMYIGWRGRAKRQDQRIGELPGVPEDRGNELLPPTSGLYVGSTIAPSWQDRIAVGDLGFRAEAHLSRYEHGILLERTGAAPLWIPQDSIRAIRTERGLAGKVMTKDGVLVIRWELPSGTEIDTGFRGDDKTVYPLWTEEDSTTATGSDSAPQNGESA